MATPLNQITTVQQCIQYAQEGVVSAASKCPGSMAAYNNAHTQGVLLLASVKSGAMTEAAAVSKLKTLLDQANNKCHTEYYGSSSTKAQGSQVVTKQSSDDVVITPKSGDGGAGLGIGILALGLGLGLLMLGGKKKVKRNPGRSATASGVKVTCRHCGAPQYTHRVIIDSRKRRRRVKQTFCTRCGGKLRR